MPKSPARLARRQSGSSTRCEPRVPVDESRHVAEALKAVNAKYKYTEYSGVGPQFLGPGLREPDLVPWLLEQSSEH